MGGIVARFSRDWLPGGMIYRHVAGAELQTTDFARRLHMKSQVSKVESSGDYAVQEADYNGIMKTSLIPPGSQAPADDDMTMDELLALIYNSLDSKKAEQISIIDMTGQVDYLDYLIICTAQTEIHARSLVDQITTDLARYDIMADGLHGYAHGDWIVADYGVLVVHIFLPKTRDFYRLEELWAAGRAVELK